jgi:hypothetical protein
VQSALAAAAAAPPAVVELRLLHAATGKAVTKRLPAGTTVGALRLLCERLLRVKAGRQQTLTLELPAGSLGGGAEGVDLGGDDTKTLRHWDVPARGATLRVSDDVSGGGGGGGGSGTAGGSGGGGAVAAAAAAAAAASGGGTGSGSGGAAACAPLRIAAAAVR